MDLKGQLALLLLDRNHFDYFDAATNRIVSFPFAENVINALEIIDEASFDAQIQAFVEQNSLPPANILIILTVNVLFEKDLAGLAPDQQAIQTEEFLDNVPFESLITKTIPFDEGVRITATNKTLYNSIKNSFEKRGFLIEAITPYESLGQELAQITSLDNQNVPLILQKHEYLKNNSFPVETHTPTKSITTESSSDNKKPQSKVRVFVLAGIFILLIGALIFMLMNQK